MCKSTKYYKYYFTRPEVESKVAAMFLLAFERLVAVTIRCIAAFQANS